MRHVMMSAVSCLVRSHPRRAPLIAVQHANMDTIFLGLVFAVRHCGVQGGPSIDKVAACGMRKIFMVQLDTERPRHSNTKYQAPPITLPPGSHAFMSACAEETARDQLGLSAVGARVPPCLSNVMTLLDALTCRVYVLLSVST